MTRPVCSTCGHTLTKCEDVSGYYCEMCVHGRIRSCKKHGTVFTGHDEECYRCLREDRDRWRAAAIAWDRFASETVPVNCGDRNLYTAATRRMERAEAGE